MAGTCRRCRCKFEIPAEDLEFYGKISPVFGDRRVEIPPPDHCPDCRVQRRTAWRNEYRYYQRACSACKKSIVSVHSPDKPYPVYCNSCWWSDSWSPLEFGRAVDLGRSFFEQFLELQSGVPQLAMMNDNGVGSENCEYCNDFAFSKNCYLVTGSWHARDCMYSSCCNHVRDIVDCDMVNLESELVYESIDSQKLYGCSYLQSSSGCSSCHFGIDLRGCSDCWFCVGLRQKRYCIFNEQFSEGEYRKRVAEFDLGSYKLREELKQRFSDFARNYPRKASQLINCEDCRGDNLYNCRKVFGFDIFNGEFTKYYIKGDSPQHCHDIHNSGGCQWCYDCITPDNSYMVAFSLWCWKSKHVLYSDNCHSSEQLLGCISLKRGKYCILNRQYSKEEYEALAPQVIDAMRERGEWGGFFPIELSPFAYNESLASELFPLTQSQAVEQRLHWKEKAAKEYRPASAELPDHVDHAADTLTKEILACAACGKNYKILPLELAFYRRQRHALPRQCSDCRRAARQAMRVPYTLQIRQCSVCGKEVETGYTAALAPRVLCEACHQSQVY